MGEEYVQEEFLVKSLWVQSIRVKSMCKKSFWVKGLWVKSILVKSVCKKNFWVKSLLVKSIWLKKYLQEESLGEKYIGEMSVTKSFWVKSPR